jgi:hypothetical protein
MPSLKASAGPVRNVITAPVLAVTVSHSFVGIWAEF